MSPTISEANLTTPFQSSVFVSKTFSITSSVKLVNLRSPDIPFQASVRGFVDGSSSVAPAIKPFTASTGLLITSIKSIRGPCPAGNPSALSKKLFDFGSSPICLNLVSKLSF